ncbi:hypothetical protein GQ457_09G030860 [Hibiscus cannabinus]
MTSIFDSERCDDLMRGFLDSTTESVVEQCEVNVESREDNQLADRITLIDIRNYITSSLPHGQRGAGMDKDSLRPMNEVIEVNDPCRFRLLVMGDNNECEKFTSHIYSFSVEQYQRELSSNEFWMQQVREGTKVKENDVSKTTQFSQSCAGQLDNLLLVDNEILKISEFGLSALPQQVRDNVLLNTLYRIPNDDAPGMINNKGYYGVKANFGSFGVILLDLMVGYLSFEDHNLMGFYKKIFKDEFNYSPWVSSSTKKSIKRITDLDPLTKIPIDEIIENKWFKKRYMPPMFEQTDISRDDVGAIFIDLGNSQNLVIEQREEGSVAPATMNAFELISTSHGPDLNNLCEKQMRLVKWDTRLTSKCHANEIIAKIKATVMPMDFSVKKNNYKMKLLGEKIGCKGQLVVTAFLLDILLFMNYFSRGGFTVEEVDIFLSDEKGELILESFLEKMIAYAINSLLLLKFIYVLLRRISTIYGSPYKELGDKDMSTVVVVCVFMHDLFHVLFEQRGIMVLVYRTKFVSVLERLDTSFPFDPGLLIGGDSFTRPMLGFWSMVTLLHPTYNYALVAYKSSPLGNVVASMVYAMQLPPKLLQCRGSSIYLVDLKGSIIMGLLIVVVVRKRAWDSIWSNHLKKAGRIQCCSRVVQRLGLLFTLILEVKDLFEGRSIVMTQNKGGKLCHFV